MKKNLFAFFIAALAVIFIVIGFIGPWYSFHLEVESDIIQNDMNYNLHFYLSNAVFEGEVFGNSISQTYYYSSIRDLISKIPGFNPQSSTINQVLGFYDITKFIVIFTIIFSIATIISSVATIFKIKKYKLLKKLNMAFSSISFSFAIGAFFYFMLTWSSMIHRGISLFLSVTTIIPIPSQISDMGFWYSFSQGGNQISMGPGLSWYLLLFGAILLLISVVIIFKTNKTDRKEKID
jgi:hypothetical protein